MQSNESNIKEKNKCPKCGLNIEQGSLFCANCGTKNTNENIKQFCNNCGEAIESGEIFCGNCGMSISNAYKQNKNNISSKPSSIWIGFIVGFVSLIALAFTTYKLNIVSLDTLLHDDSVTLEQKPSFEDYKLVTAIFNYRQAMLGEIASGTKVVFTGMVNQMISDNTAKMFTKPEQMLNEILYVEDDVFLSFKSKPQILNNDVVRIYGRYYGTQTYETVLHTEVTVPKIVVDYYELNGQLYDATSGQEIVNANQETNNNSDMDLIKQQQETTTQDYNDSQEKSATLTPFSQLSEEIRKGYAYEFMTGGKDMVNLDDVGIGMYDNTILYCLTGMDSCATEDEVKDYADSKRGFK